MSLLIEADTEKKQIRKTRYCLTYKGQYFEINIYLFWQECAIAEIELSNEYDKIEFPLELKILKEVTEDVDYKNVLLAERRI